MNLDDLKSYTTIDKSGMIKDLQALPQYLGSAWEDGLEKLQKVPKFTNIQKILICGMGGSAIAGDLVTAYAQSRCSLPIVVSREYDLPLWAFDGSTLIIFSSHSGGTEETLSVASQALAKDLPMIAISTGGTLTTRLKAANKPVLLFKHDGQPRSAIGFTFSYLLAILFKNGWIPDPSESIAKSVASMRFLAKAYDPTNPVHQNPAKMLAGQMVGRNIVIIGSGLLAPIARRWKGQINELAKTWCAYDAIPEACHNSIAGSQFPSDPICNNFVLFLVGERDHQRNKKRSKLVKNLLMVQGFVTDDVNIRGSDDMEMMWNATTFGDYTSYFLAIANEVDPTPIEMIQGFKKELGDFPE